MRAAVLCFEILPNGSQESKRKNRQWIAKIPLRQLADEGMEVNPAWLAWSFVNRTRIGVEAE
jgi:hypothetical protein